MKLTAVDITDKDRDDGIDGERLLRIDMDSEEVSAYQYVMLYVNGVQKGGLRIVPNTAQPRPRPEFGSSDGSVPMA
jgi:hypothetical protein